MLRNRVSEGPRGDAAPRRYIETLVGANDQLYAGMLLFVSCLEMMGPLALLLVARAVTARRVAALPGVRRAALSLWVCGEAAFYVACLAVAMRENLRLGGSACPPPFAAVKTREWRRGIWRRILRDPSLSDESVDALTNGKTALYAAALQGHSEICHQLLLAGASPLFAVKGGTTCVTAATRSGSAACVTAIVKHHTCNKALINAADSDGYTPIMVAAMKGALDCAAVLLKEGANADAQKRDGTTALYLAVSNGHQHCAQALVDAGANVDVRRKDGANALVIAATMGRNKCVQLLLEAGCPLDAADEDGTAIENARMQGHRDCELLLREARDAAAAEAKRKKEIPGDRPGEEDEDEGSEDGGGDAADDDNESGDGDGDGATGEEAEEEEEAVPLFALSQLPADELASKTSLIDSTSLIAVTSARLECEARAVTPPPGPIIDIPASRNFPYPCPFSARW